MDNRAVAVPVLVPERCSDGRPDTADRALAHRLRHAGNAADAGPHGILLSNDDGGDLLP